MTIQVLAIRPCSVFLPSLVQPAAAPSAEHRGFLGHTILNIQQSVLKVNKVLYQQTGSGGRRKGHLSQADLLAVGVNLHLWSPWLCSRCQGDWPGVQTWAWRCKWCELVASKVPTGAELECKLIPSYTYPFMPREQTAALQVMARESQHTGSVNREFRIKCEHTA